MTNTNHAGLTISKKVSVVTSEQSSTSSFKSVYGRATTGAASIMVVGTSGGAEEGRGGSRSRASPSSSDTLEEGSTSNEDTSVRQINGDIKLDELKTSMGIFGYLSLQ